MGYGESFGLSRFVGLPAGDMGEVLARPAPRVLSEFHLKLIAAAGAGLADPISIVGAQRRELLRRLRDAQHAAMGEPADSDASLLLEGIALRLQADLRWLEACQRNWASRRSNHRRSDR